MVGVIGFLVGKWFQSFLLICFVILATLICGSIKELLMSITPSNREVLLNVEVPSSDQDTLSIPLPPWRSIDIVWLIHSRALKGLTATQRRVGLLGAPPRDTRPRAHRVKSEWHSAERMDNRGGWVGTCVSTM